MAHIGLQDIESALKKSGLPLSGSDAMKRVAPMAGYAIDASVPQTQVPDGGYRQKLDQIAAMDKKLGAVYSDPTSNLYIENPMARQNLVSGATNQQYQQAGDIKEQQIRQQQEEDRKREQLVRETEDYYRALIQIQTKEEKLLGKSGKGSKKKTTIEEMAGLYDPQVAKLWRQSLTKEQKTRWLMAVTSGEPSAAGPGKPVIGEIPDGGFTKDDVQLFYDSENQTKLEEKKAKEQAKKKKSSNVDDALDALLNNLPSGPAK